MCWSNSHIFLLRPHNCSRSPRPCVPGLCGSGTSVQHRRRRPSILPVVASTAADPELPAQTAAGATAPRGLLHTERHVRPPAAASLASAVTSVSCAEQVSDGIRYKHHYGQSDAACFDQAVIFCLKFLEIYTNANFFTFT